jgi:hypothetical protein
LQANLWVRRNSRCLVLRARNSMNLACLRVIGRKQTGHPKVPCQTSIKFLQKSRITAFLADFR